MSSNPFKKKFCVHFIGIGGVSMSALAKYLILDGFLVSGSDRAYSSQIENLRRLGAKINVGHNSNNVIGADLVVYNSAIQPDNPECNFALKNKIPIISRAQLLQMIGRQFKLRIGVAGSHGKTTVTSIIAHIFMCSNLPFTAHIGGYDKKLGNLPNLGKDFFLSEVCEFNKNIRLFEPDIALCLNIDNDHLNCYGDVKILKQTMFEYLQKASTQIINIDDKYLNEYPLSKIAFGVNQGDYYVKRSKRLDSGLIDLEIYEYDKHLLNYQVDLSIFYTYHNLLAAITTARQLNITKQCILEGLKSFSGVERRYEYLGEIDGKSVYIDYAHHPTEISVALKVHNLKYNNTLVIFQPHTYSRTKLLFNDFIKILNSQPNLIIYKTYAARENYDLEGSAERLANACHNAIYIDNNDELIKYILKNDCDTILVLGAGDLYQFFKDQIKKDRS